MNIPNFITLIRFFLIPLYLIVFFSELQHSNLYAFLILLLAGLSDMLDGYLARKNGQITELGKLIDPLADKLMMIAVMFSFVIDQRITWIAAGVFFLRDAGMILISAFFHFRKNKRIMAANLFGKATTVFFYLAFLLIMFQLPYAQEALWLGIILSFITSFIYLYSFIKNKDQLKRVSQL
jgi:cardiolipin synthase